MAFTEEARKKALEARAAKKAAQGDDAPIAEDTIENEATLAEPPSVGSTEKENERLRLELENMQLRLQLALQQQHQPPETNKEEEKPAEEEDYLVTVLWGYPKPATKVEFIDAFEFKGGVAKNIPWSVAKHWTKGTRKDGGVPVGRVKVTVLANDATPADYVKAVGIEKISPENMAAILDSMNVDEIAASMSDDQLEMLVRNLQIRRNRRQSTVIR